MGRLWPYYEYKNRVEVTKAINTLAYYARSLITTVKKFIGQAPGVNFHNLYPSPMLRKNKLECFLSLAKFSA
jgi:hypothetical protein